MFLRLLGVLVVLALAPFALAACGGDDEGEETAATTTTTTETTDEAATGGGGGTGGTLEVSADPGGALEFEQDSLQTQAGEVTIEFTNESDVPHDVQIEGDEGDVGGTDVITSDTTEATVELEAGDYTFYCSVPGHREAGMEGDLTVN